MGGSHMLVRRGPCLLVAVLVLGLTPGSAADNDFVIVVHESNATPALARARVDAMFLGKIAKWPDGSDVTVVSNRDEALCEEFSQAIHARSGAAVTAYWAAKTFKEFVPPPPKLDDTEVIEFVRDNPGAIGFVRRGVSLRGVNTLALLD